MPDISVLIDCAVWRKITNRSNTAEKFVPVVLADFRANQILFRIQIRALYKPHVYFMLTIYLRTSRSCSRSA